jgi:hypothetical protein
MPCTDAQKRATVKYIYKCPENLEKHRKLALASYYKSRERPEVVERTRLYAERRRYINKEIKEFLNILLE